MFQWLSQLFGRRTGLRPAPHLEAVAVHNHYGWPVLAEAQAHTTVYRQSPWVYVAINRIAEAAALVPLSVARVQGEQRAAVERHPLEVLLDSPNPYLSRFELMEQTFGLLELTGSAYWFLAGGSSGVPTQIWPLRPDRVTIVPDPADYVRGYLYEIDGQRIPLDAREVVHFKRWHPANDYYGLSALEAARVAIESDRAMAEWNRNTFGKDNGVPAGIVTVDSKMPPADYERLKREWQQSHGGGQRRTAFLPSGVIQWQNIGLNHSELDFLRGRESHRDEILNIFGIPVGLVDANATEANAQVAERMFVERTLWPKLVRVAQKITQEMLPFWPGEHVAEFDDIRPTDTQARLDEIRVSYPVLSINEIRQRYFQLPAVEWGALPVGEEKTHAEEQRSRDTEKPLDDERGQGTGESSDDAGTPPADASEPAPVKAVIDELWGWERFALKRRGRINGRTFEVRHVPDHLAFEVAAGLLAAQSPDDVRQVSVLKKSLTHVVIASHKYQGLKGKFSGARNSRYIDLLRNTVAKFV